MSEVTVPVSFFGKLPSRGDFVKTSDSHQLMILLDRWAGQGLELLSKDAAWKQIYDDAPALNFAFLGSRSKLAIAGHLLPSGDASQRRFPFLSATRLEVSPPLDFIARSPLAFSRLWATLGRMSSEAVKAQDASESLRKMMEARLLLNAVPSAYDAPFFDFLDMQTMGSLQDILRESGHGQVVLKWALPALGLLLQPALTGAAVHIEKGLSLPLAKDPLYRPLVAAFWLDLVAGFVGRTDFELAVLMGDGAAPRLIVGFNGADGNTLHSAMDLQAGREQLIRVDDAEWVEEQLQSEYGLHKLASYLERDELSLRSARQVFRETFLGA